MIVTIMISSNRAGDMITTHQNTPENGGVAIDILVLCSLNTDIITRSTMINARLFAYLDQSWN